MRVFAETAGGFSRAGVSGFPKPGPASAADGGEARIGAFPAHTRPLSFFRFSPTTFPGPGLLSSRIFTTRPTCEVENSEAGRGRQRRRASVLARTRPLSLSVFNLT